MANRYMRRYPTSLIIREKQIETAVRWPLACHDGIIRSVGEDVAGALIHCWRERQLVQPLCKTVWRFVKKLCPLGVSP